MNVSIIDQFKKDLKNYCGYTDKGVKAVFNEINFKTEAVEKMISAIAEFLETDKKFLLLIGSTGIGKSYLTQKMVAEHFYNNHKKIADAFGNIWLYYCYHYEIILKSKSGNSIITSFNNFSRLSNINFLIIDEFCEFKMSESDCDYVGNLLKKRYENNTKTIIISNKTSKDIASEFDVSINDRIFNNGNLIKVVFGESLRK